MLQNGVEDAVTGAFLGVVGVATTGRGNDGGNLIRHEGHVRPGRPGARGTAAGAGSGRSGTRHSSTRYKGAHGIHNTIMS
jgi:hypothetical protein